MKKNLTLTIFIIAVILIGMSGIAHAEIKYTLLETMPGFFQSGSQTSDFPALILAIYKFGIWTVGIAGLFMLTIGGFWYMTSAGNNATAETAKKIIWDSLLGIVAALAAFLIMYVINPDLTKINIAFIKLEKTTETPGGTPPGGTPPGGTPGGECTGATIACCKQGTQCQNCSDCVDFSNGYSRLCYLGGGLSSCKLNSTLASKIKNANLENHGAQVSEAWPPTVNHSSPCHTNGTCADVRFTGGHSVSDVKEIMDALKSTGLSSMVFEYKGDCSSYIEVGINCKKYSTMTSNASIHVNL